MDKLGQLWLGDYKKIYIFLNLTVNIKHTTNKESSMAKSNIFPPPLSCLYFQDDRKPLKIVSYRMLKEGYEALKRGYAIKFDVFDRYQHAGTDRA